MNILISIKEKWAEAILDGRKTVELRRTCPKGIRKVSGYFPARDTIYIVSTPGKHVVGKAVVNLYTHCEAVLNKYAPDGIGVKLLRDACVTREEYEAYAPKYTWELSFPVRFKKPVPLADIGLARSPQSWQYLTDEQAVTLQNRRGG